MRLHNIIRTIITLVLIYFVWKSSSWPVALAITLLGIDDIIIRRILGQEREHRVDRQKVEQRLFRKLKKLRTEHEKLVAKK